MADYLANAWEKLTLKNTCNCPEPFAKCCCAASILLMFGSHQMNLCEKRLMKASFQRRFPINSLGSEQLQNDYGE